MQIWTLFTTVQHKYNLRKSVFHCYTNVIKLKEAQTQTNTFLLYIQNITSLKEANLKHLGKEKINRKLLMFIKDR